MNEFYMSTVSSVNKRSGVNEQTLPDEVMINKVDTLGNAKCQKTPTFFDFWPCRYFIIRLGIQ